jgi:hypothetical protein
MRGAGAAALAALALVLPGCAGGDDDAAPAAPPAELLAQAADRLREQATFTFEADYVRTRADRPDDPETYAEVEGVLDLARGRGRATVELLALGLPDSGDEPGLDDPITLRWDREMFEAEIDGEPRRMSRARARTSAGLIGRLPDEPEALARLLELAENARLLDDGRIDFTVEPGKAARAGAPAELTDAAAAGLLGATLPLEVSLGDDGLPERIAYRVELEPTAALPGRTIVVTYELADFGKPYPG